MKRFVNGAEHELSDGAEVLWVGDRWAVRTSEGLATAAAVRDGDKTLISYKGHQYVVTAKAPASRTRGGAASGELTAPMPGQIVDVLVAEGQSVTKGQKLLVLEAMKTQQPFAAPFDGVVSKVGVQKGQQVNDGAVLAIVAPLATNDSPAS